VIERVARWRHVGCVELQGLRTIDDELACGLAVLCADGDGGEGEHPDDPEQLCHARLPGRILLPRGDRLTDAFGPFSPAWHSSEG